MTRKQFLTIRDIITPCNLQHKRKNMVSPQTDSTNLVFWSLVLSYHGLSANYESGEWNWEPFSFQS